MKKEDEKKSSEKKISGTKSSGKKLKVKEILLETETDPEFQDERETGKNRNTELVILTYIFGIMFLSMIVYLGYMNLFKREELNTNTYNTKQDASSDNIIRGDIVTENGTVLATTSLDYSGNEVRYYPYYNMFAHTIGYATNGKSGLEATANTYLMSSHSSLIDQIKSASDSEKIKGDSVVVTLDVNLQQACYNALGGYKGAIVVMEPDSGKILAMVSKPDFDPNVIAASWEEMMSDSGNSSLLNRATQGLYPPGSTFKILTSLAYLRQNNGDADSFLYDCVGETTEGDVTINCYNYSVHGQETLADAFANSCNTAFATIGLGLDNGEFRKLAEDFLFNKALPTKLTTERSSFVLDKNTSSGDQMTTAIGQGDTLVTPLHMAMITSTVANGGILMKPYMIARVETTDGKTVMEEKPDMYDQLMTVEEASAIAGFMRGTVTNGTGQALSWNSYTVAGKTGSAEYEVGDTMGTHSWFVGYSNVDDPDIVVAIIAEDGGTGSSTAVPIAQQIFDTYYAYH